MLIINLLGEEIYMKKVFLLSTMLLLPAMSHASEAVRWDSLSFGYETVDSNGDELTGFNVSGSKLLSESVFVAGSYSRAENDMSVQGYDFDIEYNVLSLGLGYRYAISQTSDVFASVAYEELELNINSSIYDEGDSDDGFSLNTGIRSALSDRLEVGATLQYIKIGDENETGLKLSALYKLTEELSVGVGYKKVDEQETLTLSASIYF
jgi:opacity protein-like surface antigen